MTDQLDISDVSRLRSREGWGVDVCWAEGTDAATYMHFPRRRFRLVPVEEPKT